MVSPGNLLTGVIGASFWLSESSAGVRDDPVAPVIVAAGIAARLKGKNSG
jgi:hypothetical protein